MLIIFLQIWFCTTNSGIENNELIDRSTMDFNKLTSLAPCSYGNESENIEIFIVLDQSILHSIGGVFTKPIRRN